MQLLVPIVPMQTSKGRPIFQEAAQWDSHVQLHDGRLAQAGCGSAAGCNAASSGQGRGQQAFNREAVSVSVNT